jgi:hypothetical protein
MFNNNESLLAVTVKRPSRRSSRASTASFSDSASRRQTQFLCRPNSSAAPHASDHLTQIWCLHDSHLIELTRRPAFGFNPLLAAVLERSSPGDRCADNVRSDGIAYRSRGIVRGAANRANSSLTSGQRFPLIPKSAKNGGFCFTISRWWMMNRRIFSLREMVTMATLDST